VSEKGAKIMSKKFNFIVFEDIGAKRGNYTISITRHGAFGFNSGFYKKQNIKDFSRVILSFDKNKRAVGFNFTKKQNLKSAWKLTHIKNSANVVPRSFFRAYAIDPKDYTGRYEPKEYKDSKIGTLFYIILQKKTK